jgi:hypothetical protein
MYLEFSRSCGIPRAFKGRSDMQQNLILAYCGGYNVEKVAPFVASWRNNVKSARLIVAFTNMTADTMATLRHFGVEFLDIESYWPSEYIAITLRFFIWRDYMRQHGNLFSKVMVADIRDVVFQSDPFLTDLERPVMFASEDKSLRSDPNWNLRWVTELFGQEKVETFADQMASCCGTTLGTSAAMSAYLEDLCTLIETTEFNRKGVYEQGFHNYLVHSIKPEYGALDADLNLFATLGTIPASRIGVSGDKILLDSKEVPIVHQWDRHGPLVQLMKDSPAFKLAD